MGRFSYTGILVQTRQRVPHVSVDTAVHKCFRWVNQGILYAIIPEVYHLAHAQRLTPVEAALAGKPANPESARAPAAVAAIDNVSSDIHASAEYRAAMVKVVIRW